MKAVSRGQALEISARVATQVDWDQLDGEKLQREVIELSPEEFGRRFVAFLSNGALLVVGALFLIINRAKKFNPAKFIGQGWTIWLGPKDGGGLSGDEAQDTRSLALTQIDWAKVRFETCLRAGETRITGEEKLARLIKSGVIRLDAAVGEVLWLDYKSNKENSVLEKLRREKNITYLDFFGTILRNPHGHRCVLCLYWSGGQWYWSVNRLDDDWDAGDPSAVLAS